MKSLIVSFGVITGGLLLFAVCEASPSPEASFNVRTFPSGNPVPVAMTKTLFAPLQQQLKNKSVLNLLNPNNVNGAVTLTEDQAAYVLADRIVYALGLFYGTINTLSSYLSDLFNPSYTP